MTYLKVDEEIELKALDLTNTEELFKVTNLSRAHLRQWLPWLDYTKSSDDTRKFIESSIEQIKDSNGFHAGIWYQQSLAGIIGFHSIDKLNRKTSMGYWLAESYQGKGIMTRSCKAMVEYAFKELYLNRVEIRCAEGNVKSRAIPERLGFIVEGVSQNAEWLYDHYVNHVIYAMLKRSWN